MDLAAEDPYHTIASVIALAGGALVIAAAALCYHLVTGIVVRAGRSPRTPDTRRAAELLKSRFFCRDAYPDRAAPSYWLTFFYPHWWTDLLSALDSLAEIGFPASDPDIARGEAWSISNQEPSGLWNTGHNQPKGRHSDLLAVAL